MEASVMAMGFAFAVGGALGFILAGLMFTAGETREIRDRSEAIEVRFRNKRRDG